MNLLKATELQTGGFHFTTTNDGYTRPHACCRQHDLTPHATAEEAERCQYEYELARAVYHRGGLMAHPCKECGEWTDGAYLIGGFDSVDLCPTHALPDMLRKHHPFVPGIESWES